MIFNGSRGKRNDRTPTVIRTGTSAAASNVRDKQSDNLKENCTSPYNKQVFTNVIDKKKCLLRSPAGSELRSITSVRS